MSLTLSPTESKQTIIDLTRKEPLIWNKSSPTYKGKMPKEGVLPVRRAGLGAEPKGSVFSKRPPCKSISFPSMKFLCCREPNTGCAGALVGRSRIGRVKQEGRSILMRRVGPSIDREELRVKGERPIRTLLRTREQQEIVGNLDLDVNPTLICDFST